MLKGQKNLGCLVILIAIIVLVNVNAANASRIAITTPRLERITFREVQLKDRVYKLIVNNNEKSITVEGVVLDFEEMDEVENHFKRIAPTDYQFICNLNFSN